MIQLVYTSLARRPTADVILSIARSAERRNREMGVSGMLIHDKAVYLQLLEGQTAAVTELYAVIRRDDRHTVVSEWRREVDRRVLNTALPMGYKRAEIPMNFVLDLKTCGPAAVDLAVEEARLKYPRSSGLGDAGPDHAPPPGGQAARE